MDDKNHDEKIMGNGSTPENMEKTDGSSDAPRRGSVRRILRWTAFGMAGLLGLVTVSAGGGLLFLRSDMGERWLTNAVNSALTKLPSGMSGHIASFKGPLLSEAHLEGIVLKDLKGEWLTAKSANLRIDWSALPSAFVISEISVDRPVLLRSPELEVSSEPAPEVQTEQAVTPEEMLGKLDEFLKNWPSYLPELRLEELALRSAEVSKEASPYPFTATASASASAGRDGLKAKLSLLREDGPLPVDAPNRRASVEAALVPDLRFRLDASLGDLGFASAFMPSQLASSPAFLLALSGDAPIADWKASLNASLRDEALKSGEGAANVITALAGRLGLRPFGSEPAADASLEVTGGALAKRLWAMAGQKDGRLSLKLDASAKGGDRPEAVTALEIQLADMQWGSPMLDALLGRELSAGTAASAGMDSAGTLRTDLKKLYAHAAHIKADANGSALLDGRGLASSRVDMEAAFELNDAATLSPELSGDMKALASVSGALTALKTQIGLKGSRIDTKSLKFKDVDISLGIPSADVARIVDALSGISLGKAAGPLMDGGLKASLAVNGHPVSLSTNWLVGEAGKSGLDIALDHLDLRAGQNSLTGQLAAKLAKSSNAPAKGTVAAMIGTDLPALDGSFGVDIADWEMLKGLSGIPMAGKPLTAEFQLENKGRQALAFEASLPEFHIDASGQKIDLADFRLDMSVADLWGKPAADLSALFSELKADRAVLRDTSLHAEGGLDAFSLVLESAGGVESRIKAEWKPGAVLVDELEALLHPEELGFRKGDAVGLMLSTPLKASYSGDSVDVAAFSADILPAGRLDVEGMFSPSRMKGHFSLGGLELGSFRQFSQALPGGVVDMAAEFSGSPHAPAGKFKLNLKDILVPGSRLDAIDAELSGTLGMKGRRRMLEARLDMPEKTLKALSLDRFSAKALVPFTSPANGVAQPDMKAPFKAELALGGEVGGLWNLVPAADMRLSGRLKLDSKVAGSLSAPVVTAHAAMDGGRFLDILNGVALSGIKLRLDADKFDIVRKKAADKVKFSLSARGGSKGTLDVGGWLDPADMSLDIDGTMKSLAPLRRQDAKVMLSGTLGVKGTVTSPLVSADITVDKGQVELAKLPGASIPELEIWTPEKEKAEEEAPAAPGHLDVRIRIPNQFFVRGYGLDCEWGGELRIDAPITRPAVKGRLQAVRGTLDILGKNFKLARGDIRFDGGWPVSPLLDIDMQYVASNLTADIIVGGTASNPKLELTSQPVYPQDEIISQIMFGQSSGSLSHVQAIQLASGVASLTGFGGAGVMDIGRKVLGVDVFRLNSDNDGEDSDVSNTSLEVGTYVRDNVYVGMEQGVGKEADTGAVVEIELLPSLELQAKAGSKDSEIGLEWKKNY